MKAFSVALALGIISIIAIECYNTGKTDSFCTEQHGQEIFADGIIIGCITRAPVQANHANTTTAP